jgi:hypothetical protein
VQEGQGEKLGGAAVASPSSSPPMALELGWPSRAGTRRWEQPLVVGCPGSATLGAMLVRQACQQATVPATGKEPTSPAGELVGVVQQSVCAMFSAPPTWGELGRECCPVLGHPQPAGNGEAAVLAPGWRATSHTPMPQTSP